MENKIYSGERVGISGELTKAVTTIVNGVPVTTPAETTTAEEVCVEIIQFGKVLVSCPLEVADGKYTGEIPTEGIVGNVILRVKVKDAGGIVISNEEIPIAIHW